MRVTKMFFVALLFELMFSIMSFAQNKSVNQLIVEAAQRYQNRTDGGTCHEFVGKVLREVGLNIGAGYRQAYLNHGFEVASNEVIAGDVMQISDDSAGETEYKDGYHSAIILANKGGGRYDVIHSNWCNPPTCNTVSRTYNYNFFDYARSKSQGKNYTLTVHFYRLGSSGTEKVGYFSDGWYQDGVSRTFLDAYNRYDELITFS